MRGHYIWVLLTTMKFYLYYLGFSTVHVLSGIVTFGTYGKIMHILYHDLLKHFCHYFLYISKRFIFPKDYNYYSLLDIKLISHT